MAKSNKKKRSKRKHTLDTQKMFSSVLYEAVNNSQSDALKWSADGSSILIQRETFEEEFLKPKQLFKTSKIVSFIRQLNLYGFTKLSPKRSKNYSLPNRAIYDEYFHKNFKRDQPNLLAHLHPRSKSEVHEAMKERKRSRSQRKACETVSNREMRITVSNNLN